MQTRETVQMIGKNIKVYGQSQLSFLRDDILEFLCREDVNKGYKAETYYVLQTLVELAVKDNDQSVINFNELMNRLSSEGYGSLMILKNR